MPWIGIALALLPKVEEDESTKIVVSVTLMARQSQLSPSLVAQQKDSPDGKFCLIGNVDVPKYVDHLVEDHIVEEVARPKCYALFGQKCSVMSYLGDEVDKRGYGFEATVSKTPTGNSVRLSLGNPGNNGLVNASTFVLPLKSDECAFVIPKHQICGMDMLAIAKVTVVNQSVEILVDH